MGQRHQVYYRLPKEFFGANHFANRPERTIGFHVQWSYGTLPIRNLARVFDYVRKGGRDAPLEWSMPYSFHSDLQFVQAFDAEQGVVSRYYPLGKIESSYGDDQGRGDDSDAPTLLDPRNGDNNDGITVVDMVPVAKGKPPTYCLVSLDGFWAAERGEKAKALKAYSAADYINFYYAPDSERRPKNTDALIKSLDGFKVMTQARLKAIFPAMFKPVE